MSLETLRTRLAYSGGNRQIDRMNEDKLRSLKKALLYSYQSETAILEDGREFRCLINPDKIKNQYDNKIISIPFSDICLGTVKREIDEETGEEIFIETRPVINEKTNQGIQLIGMKPGDVFEWKENKTYWIVYLHRFEETAYFRAEIRRCKYEVKIYDTTYKVYAAIPSVTEIDWRNEKNTNWNDLDYKVDMYITKNKETEEYLKRFAKIKLNGKTWEVQSADSMSSDGIIIVNLKEYYENTPEEKYLERKEQEEKNENEDLEDVQEFYISGDKQVEPYMTYTYNINNEINKGIWSIDNSKGKILKQTSSSVEVYVNTGRSGSFNLTYSAENEIKSNLEIKIMSI